MTTTADDLRRELGELLARRARADIPERDFQRRLTASSVALCRSVVSERLAADEPILAEHHLVHSHFKLTQSVLQEPEQATVSFFATPRRLIRVRGSQRPRRAVTCDEADGTVVDEVSYARVRALARRRQWRWGEVGVGLAAVLLALAARHALAVTGPMLALLGLAGALHGLLLPTRWIEIVTQDAPCEPPFEIHGLRRRSARRMLAVVRDVARANGMAENRQEE